MLRILFQGEDMHAAGSGFVVGRSGPVKELQAVPVGDDHQIVTNLNFRCGHVGIFFRVHHRHILHMTRLCRVGHIDDFDTVTEEASAVEIVSSVRCFIEL